MEKLPKEVQEIIKYYASWNYKPWDNDFTNALDAMLSMITELAPYLEDNYLPDRVSEGYLKPGEDRCPSLARIAEQKRKERRAQTPSSLSDDEAH